MTEEKGMTTEKPILFSTEMVQALLEGRKTQTRRMLPDWCNQYSKAELVSDPELCDPKALEFNEIKPKQFYGLYACFDEGEEHFKCKYCKGGTLWVRETWNWDYKKYPERDEKFYFYKATTGDDFLASGEKWKPSIFMPKEACRLRLEITDVRVERLQDISEYDAMCEGDPRQGLIASENTHIDWFQTLWQKINGNWEENPWVWVLTFTRIY